MREPLELVLRILQLRRYARLKAAVEQAEAQEQDPPRGYETVWKVRGLVAAGKSESDLPTLDDQAQIERELFG